MTAPSPLSLVTRQARLLAVRDTLDAGGVAASMWFYTGTEPPPTPETATTETLLCTLDLAAPCGTVGADGALATLSISVPRTALAIATGVIGWVRFMDAAGAAVMDRLVTNLAGVGPVRVGDTQVYTGGELQMTSCVFTE